LVFRPAGHGALLENLNNLHGDLVFVRTIDNILHQDRHGEVSRWKKILGGYLVDLQETVFDLLSQLISEAASEANIAGAEALCRSRLGLEAMPANLKNLPFQARRDYWIDRLNRPIRVCGVVRREKDPGGAPFWVTDRDGKESLQLVERAQIDATSRQQLEVWEAAEFFNPVDIVCGVRDVHGKPFELDRFKDPGSASSTTKMQGNQLLKTLEMPGLWNGSMAYWNTVFIEVPRSTFQPVKTVLDLLKPEHQG